MSNHRFIISGGGTGGHIFPALSIAEGLKQRFPDAEILFVGALGKMEMEKVPAAGFPITGLPVAGFHRGEIWRNLLFLPKLINSLWKARTVVRNFKPDCVIGVGGYASGPVLKVATRMGIPTLLQEQNSYAGVTNKLLGKKAHKICVAYPDMERFFPKEKIVFTGNPIRKGLEGIVGKSDESLKFFGLDPGKPVVLVVGGSLGARSLNNGIRAKLELIRTSGVQFLWQTGKIYYQDIKAELESSPAENIHVLEFIQRIDLAFAAADLVISRAGAGTISELCVVGLPSILVPSPNVAEDHQTANARALAGRGAAVLIRDAEVNEKLVEEALVLVRDRKRLESLSQKIREMGTPDATRDIVEVIVSLLNDKNG
ncbi:MAG TPA: undecaprenyldiphospho-muramoylpentapeptide beta-N-acetylglucosaminyltransferase [Prolixibacteraceae bacterium]|nr:undecaprenyldiphospho-muramoylpentapeptide beta-N-acetylglucosaminyltransferase [Prolixibacteraceae bacterium]